MQLFPIFSSCHLPTSSTGSSAPSFISNILPYETMPFSPEGYSHIQQLPQFAVNDFNVPFFSFQNYQPFVMSMESDPSQSINPPSPGKCLTQNHIAQMVTIRMIMSGKEVGSIIGKKGDNIKKIREESAARINISDGSCPERIVTVTGTVDKIYSAFLMMCQKFEDDYIGCINSNKKNADVTCPPVTLRLLVPATQCGSIIGKGGCKIKDIREMCGASIQVASELLPNSSERSVTVSGTANAVARCIQEISTILQETPLRCNTIPYKPKSSYSGIHTPLPSPNNLPPLFPFVGGNHEMMKHMDGYQQNNSSPTIALYPVSQSATGQILPQNMFPAYVPEHNPYHVFPPALPIWPRQHPPLSYSVKSDSLSSSQTSSVGSQLVKEFNITNDMIGCIIGRGGSTINEIRTLSGAQIKISYTEEKSTDRQITISGTPESINTAEMLINAKLNIDILTEATRKITRFCILLIGILALGLSYKFFIWIIFNKVKNSNVFLQICVIQILFILISFPFIFGYFILNAFCGYIFGTIKGTIIVAWCAGFGLASSYLFIQTWFSKEILLMIDRISSSSIKLRILQETFNDSSNVMKMIFLLRLCPVPFGFQNILFSTVKVPFFKYVAVSMIGLLPNQIFTSSIGAGIRNFQLTFSAEHITLESYAFIIPICIFACVSVFIVIKVRQKLKMLDNDKNLNQFLV